LHRHRHGLVRADRVCGVDHVEWADRIEVTQPQPHLPQILETLVEIGLADG
jgi:hypothetical protein